MGDLVRGAITSLPKHQFESGQALGLTNVQLYYHIIIPQVLKTATAGYQSCHSDD